MRLTFSIPGPLRPLADGQSSVVLDTPAATIEDAFEGLWRMCPGLRDRVLDERGAVRPHVNIFVGRESIRHLGGLTASVKDGDAIAIIPAVSGG